MDNVYKALWIKALRSGDYLQGRDQLYIKARYEIPVQFCCLGVLCEVARDKHRGFYNKSETSIDAYNLDLLFKFSNNEQIRLMGMNDDTRPGGAGVMDFSEIADYIEVSL